MNLDELKEEIKRKREEMSELNKMYYFNTTPRFLNPIEYEHRLKEFYGISKDSGATLEQLEKAGKKDYNILESIENLVDGVAMDLTEKNVKFNTLTVVFKASPFINKSEEFSNYVSIYDIVILADERTEKSLDPRSFFILNYNELVKKMKELGYEINIDKVEELNKYAVKQIKVTCDFTDINEEEKDKTKTRIIKITDTISLKY